MDSAFLKANTAECDMKEETATLIVYSEAVFLWILMYMIEVYQLITDIVFT